MNCQKSSFTKWDTDFWQPHSSLLSVNGCAFLLRSSNRFVNFFYFVFVFVLVSPCLHSRLLFYALGMEKILSGLKANFWCPALKFHRSFSTMQRYNILKSIPNLISKNCIFKGVFFLPIFSKNNPDGLCCIKGQYVYPFPYFSTLSNFENHREERILIYNIYIIYKY